MQVVRLSPMPRIRYRLLKDRVAEEFAAEFDNYLQSIGGVADGEGTTIQTTAGPLTVFLMGNSTEDFHVSTCFKDIERAKTLLGYLPGSPHRLNPHSGHWDFAGKTGVSTFKRAITAILVQPTKS